MLSSGSTFASGRHGSMASPNAFNGHCRSSSGTVLRWCSAGRLVPSLACPQNLQSGLLGLGIARPERGHEMFSPWSSVILSVPLTAHAPASHLHLPSRCRNDLVHAASGCPSLQLVGCRSVDGNTLLLLDSGAQFDCGTTDITRTVHFGEPKPHQQLTFTRVLQVQSDPCAYNTWLLDPCQEYAYPHVRCQC